MNRREFVERIEGYYGKSFTGERLEAIKHYTETEKIPEEKYEDWYYKVIHNHNNAQLPPMPALIAAWESVGSTRLSDYDKYEKIIKNNNATIASWWSYDIKKIVSILKDIRSKDSMSASDMCFVATFSIIEHEYHVMKELEYRPSDMKERLEYVKECLMNGVHFTGIQSMLSAQDAEAIKITFAKGVDDEV